MNYVSFLFLLLRGLMECCVASAQAYVYGAPAMNQAPELLRVPWRSETHKQIMTVLSSRCSVEPPNRVINIA